MGFIKKKPKEPEHEGAPDVVDQTGAHHDESDQSDGEEDEGADVSIEVDIAMVRNSGRMNLSPSCCILSLCHHHLTFQNGRSTRLILMKSKEGKAHTTTIWMTMFNFKLAY